jgi:hypothetical protein
MPPRGNQRFDFTPIVTHYLFLVTTLLAVASIPSYYRALQSSHFITDWLVYCVHLTMYRHRST